MNNYEVISREVRKQDNITVVTMKLNNPYTFLTRELVGDLTTLSDEKIIELVLERLQMEIDPAGTLARMQDALHKAEEALTTTKDLLAKTEKTQETIRGSIMEMNETLFTLTADVDELKEASGTVEEAEGEEKHVETTTPVDGAPTTEGGE